MLCQVQDRLITVHVSCRPLTRRRPSGRTLRVLTLTSVASRYTTVTLMLRVAIRQRRLSASVSAASQATVSRRVTARQYHSSTALHCNHIS